ncbi:hypothetical protein ABT144_25040 [Streptomyces sp. NPDC002039]|uniref:hypothetical protein n=1 Tax=Streptomyces sp. NPDC002039 TaxID=3154660 RepID=UPI00331D3B21
MRRAAVWARAFAAEGGRPFFDVAAYVDPEVRPTLEPAAEPADFLSRPPNGEVRGTCSGVVRTSELRAVVRTSELRARNPAAVAGLPDLHEPLVLFCERGGEPTRDNTGFLELTGVRFRPGAPESHLGNLVRPGRTPARVSRPGHGYRRHRHELPPQWP